MAFLNGTAANHVDLLSRLRTFVLANGWQELAWDGDTLCLKGTGASGTDEIYIEVSLHTNSSLNIYNLAIRGAAGWRTGAVNFDYAPNKGGTHVIAMWSNAIPFTFVADGRRIIVVCAINGNMYCGYMGLLRPIATEAQEPYPLFLAGTCDIEDTSYTSINHYSPWHTNSYYASEARSMWRPGGMLADTEQQGSELLMHPWQDDPWLTTGEVFGGGLVLRPSLVYNQYSSYQPTAFYYQTYGHMDGIFFIPGLNQVGGSTVVIGGDTYLVCNSGSHQEANDFAAIRLT